MAQTQLPPVIENARKIVTDAETTMRKQCELLNAAASGNVIDPDKMVENMSLLCKLVCLDLASADGKITEEETDLLNAIFQQSWPAEQYAALYYDLKNDFPNLISRDMGSRLLACNITIAKLLREPYDPDQDWLLNTLKTLGETVVRIDRDIAPEEKKLLADTLEKIHQEAISLLTRLAPG